MMSYPMFVIMIILSIGICAITSTVQASTLESSSGVVVTRDSAEYGQIVADKAHKMTDKASCRTMENTFNSFLKPEIKRVTIRLPMELALNQQTLNMVLQMLREADNKTVVEIALVGYGGDALQMRAIIAEIKASQACVYTRTVGDVYSAHAYIAVAGDRLVIEPHTMLLFHRSSAYGAAELACETAKGLLDRTQDAYKKCLDYFAAYTANETKFVRSFLIQFLPKKTVLDILNGHDIIIDTETMNQYLTDRGK